jgi:hypothetical protein
MSRVVSLTTFASDIVAAILDEALPPEVRLFGLTVDPPLWYSIEYHHGFCS